MQKQKHIFAFVRAAAPLPPPVLRLRRAAGGGLFSARLTPPLIYAAAAPQGRLGDHLLVFESGLCERRSGSGAALGGAGAGGGAGSQGLIRGLNHLPAPELHGRASGGQES